MKKFLWIVALVLIAAIYLFYSHSAQSPAASVKVGVILPLSGPVAQNGAPIKLGIDLAQKLIDNKNISLIYEDSQCDPKNAISAYNKLVHQDGVDIISGLICSGEALAIVPLAEKDGVLVLSSAASSPALSGISRNFFRVYPSDDNDADLISRHAKDHAKSAALISINNDYGQAIKDKISSNLKGLLSSNQTFNYGTTDFRSLLLKAKSADLIILVAYPDSTINFLKQARELGLKQPVIGSSASFTADLFKNQSLSNGFMFTSPDMDPPGRKMFADSFRMEYKNDPIFPAEYGYDTFLVLTKIMKSSSGKFELDHSAMPVLGATGPINFDDNNDRTGLPIRMYTVANAGIECFFNCK